MLFLRIAIALIVVLAFQFDTAHAQRGNNRGKGPVVGQGQSSVSRGQNALAALLSDAERQILTDYFRSNENNLPPGLAKRQDLPPGLARQMERNGTLPRGLASGEMPAALLSRLPGRGNQDVAVVGADVILIDAATRVIVDIIRDVFLTY